MDDAPLHRTKFNVDTRYIVSASVAASPGSKR